MTKRLRGGSGCIVAALGLFLCQGVNDLASAEAEPDSRALVPKIRGGHPTFEFPAVGAMSVAGSLCTVTLIGCETVLTAAHCVCPSGADDHYSTCVAQLYDPEDMSFFFQHAGFFTGRSVAIHPDFESTQGGDVAIVKLSEPVTGIAPLPINDRRRPNEGTAATILGFGRTGEFAIVPPGVGVKRIGSIVTSECGSGVRASNHVCSDATVSGASVCMGDSGGPLLVDFGDGPLVAGVASGAYSTGVGVLFCIPPFVSYSTDVYRYRSFIRQEAGSDLDAERCGDLPRLGSPDVVVYEFPGDLTPKTPALNGSFEVPAGAQLMRAIMNGVIRTDAGRNHFDFFLRRGAPPSETSYDCADTRDSAFGICEIEYPVDGTWHLLAERIAGEGEMQITVTLFTDPNAATSTPKPTATRTPPPTITPRPIPTGPVDDCVGDCDEDGTVILPEIVLGVSIALGWSPLETCRTMDFDVDGTVSIDELINAVEAALRGCRVSSESP